jgi:predicted Zn-dependent protease
VVNNVPALFVPVTVATEQGEVDLALMAYAGPGGGAFHFIMVSPPGGSAPAALQALFGSFRLLSAQEAATLRPRVIRVVAASASDSYRSLAGRMASERPLEHLLMLNGRTPDQPLRPGERLKIVTLAGG